MPDPIFERFIAQPNNKSSSYDDSRGRSTTKIADRTRCGTRMTLIRLDNWYHQTFVVALVPTHDTSRVVAILDPEWDVAFMSSSNRKERVMALKLLRQYKREVAMFK